MSEHLGYNGQYLSVDLTEGVCHAEKVEEDFYRRFGGGVGAALRIVLEESDPTTDPLAPENLLVFYCGLLAGTGSPCCPRYIACAKSPLTGGIAKSDAGGWWGPELKSAGFDGVVVRGRADDPVYLWIKDGTAEIRDARHVWGRVTGEAQGILRKELAEPRAKILQIGPAGENLVRYANICNELFHFNGRGGLGAVMGSKNLKAIAVRGTQQVVVKSRDDIRKVSRWASREFKSHPLSSALSEAGTAVAVEIFNAAGSLPTNNWQQSTFEHAEEIGAGRIEDEIFAGRRSCHGCPIGCKRTVGSERGDIRIDKMYGGPEFESLAALGSNCGNKNLLVVAKANEMCNKFTMDTISAGMTISFAMECYEKGMISLDDTGGLELTFGSEHAILGLLEQIALRKGFGDILAEGSVRVASKLGNKADDFLLEVKGQEVPFHDPRTKIGVGLQYAVSPYGADHWFAQHDSLFTRYDAPGFEGVKPLGIMRPLSATDLSPEKVRLIYYTSMMTSMYDCLGVCVFGAVARSLLPLKTIVDLVDASTGWGTSLWELMKVGERAISMARVFNHKAGFARKDDRLPRRFYTPMVGGPLDGTSELDEAQFEKALDLYYAMAGWECDSGAPSEAKLAELDLEWLVDVVKPSEKE